MAAITLELSMLFLGMMIKAVRTWMTLSFEYTQEGTGNEK
jgi:hypothetical protein